MGNSLAPLYGLEQPTWFSRLWRPTPLSRCPWIRPPRELCPLSPRQRIRLENLLHRWRELELSAWNQRQRASPPESPFVLQSISFRDRHLSRLATHLYPGATVRDLRQERQHPAPLLATAAALITSDWRWGLEALIWELTVHGLSQLPVERDRQLALLFRWLVKDSTYWDPTRRQRCPPERILELVGLQLERRRRFPERIEAFGIHPFHHRTLRFYLAGSSVRFRPLHARPSSSAQATAVLGRAANRKALERDPRKPLIQLEDGFLRSTGRGAHLQLPLSLAVDPIGIYFDATRASALECFLQDHSFLQEERQRALQLREQILSASLSKYNLDGDSWERPSLNKPVVLVAGQVEQDASIRYGAPGIRTNLELVKAALRLEHGSYVIYKPHPFVVNGRRPAGHGENTIGNLVDAVLPHVSIDTLLRQVDRVHVLTSGTGFEALLRQVPVVCHGLPFYAGWGLTQDHLVCARRQRQLSLDELVFGALMAYPRYVSPRCGWFVTAEQAVEQLISLQSNPPTRFGLARQHLAAFLPTLIP
ncbi:capsular polysaccharide biosynthesis protein [Synechococcus sp. BA-124 BA4]|uniref:capsular polysaccharide export protein, LipB/KpsS family n=1 Tax=Synechococcus sp. BA-124 BA4 TaxID=3110251 RepID=UPI002B1F55D4|nr:capsular polysaccharide biosynthesis protein [Synechococcus sp. BA-124 BA4]MEA5400714.1 capsular polysaccharide biosynthesis protein [Synechococcus sp. BA-124 BA4]